MPKASRKTKGSMKGRSAALGGLAGEGRQACQPSTGRIWAGTGSHAHSSNGAGESTAREVTEFPVNASTSRINIEPKGCVNKTVLLQDQSRLRRVAGNNFMQGGSSGQHREASRGQQSKCDCFQDVTVLDEESDIKICPLQQCPQDVRVTCAIPVTTQWDVRLSCNVLSKRRNNVSYLNTRSFHLRNLGTPRHVPECIATPPQLRKSLGNHFEEKFSISPKSLKEMPTTASSSTRQGQSTEAAVRCRTDNYSGVVKIEESPTMMLYIKKVQPTEIRVTRCAGQQQVSQQPGQYNQSSANANEPFIEEAKTAGQCETSKAPNKSTTAQKVTYSHVTHTANTYNITSGEGKYVLDSALPPLPSFNETFNKRYSLKEEKYADTLQKESSVGTSSFGMNEGPPVLSLSSTSTVPLATSTSGYMDDEDTLLLLRNTAFESFSEPRETKLNIFPSYPRFQCKMTPECNLTASASFSYQDINVPDSRVGTQHGSSIAQMDSGGGGNGCIVSVIKPEFSSTGGLQSQSGEGSFYCQGSQVVWTAQDPKFSVPNIIPKSENSEHLFNALQSGEHSFNMPQSLRKTESTLQDQKDLHKEANFIVHMTDECMSEEVHKSEADSVMQCHNSDDSNWFASDRDTVILDENKKNVISTDVVNTYSSNKLYCTGDGHAQAPGEVRPLSEEEGTFTLPSALSDLMLDAEGELNNFTQSDQDYRLLPHCTFTGDEENNVKLEDERSRQTLVSIGSVVETTFSDSINACSKKPWFEDNNYNVNDFNDLLDSLIQDIEHGKGNNDTEEAVKNDLYISMEPTTSNVTTTRKDKPIKEPTEYILKDTSKNKFAVDLKKDECWPKPLLSQVIEKDPGKDIAILVPVTASRHLHKSSSESHQIDYLISNIGTAGKVPQAVSFKTRPAGSRFVIPNITTTHRSKMQPTTSSCISKGNQSEPQNDSNCLKILSKKYSDSCSQKKQTEISCKRPSVAVPPASQNTNYCDVSEKAKLVLPVGETGVSITIPKCTPVSITSFLVPTGPSCNVLNTKPISDHQWLGFDSNSEGRIATSLPTTTALLKIKHPPNMNNKFCLQSGKKLDLSPAIINIGNAPASAELMQLQSSVPSVLLTPVGEQPLMTHVVPQGSSTHTSSNPNVSGHGAHVIKKAVTKHCLQSAFHPSVSRSEKVKPAVCSPTSRPLCPITVEEPVIIQINTKSSSKSCIVVPSSPIETRACGQGSLKSKTVEDLRGHILRKKPYPDSIKSKKVLWEDLKELLPSFPESVLSTLHLPPRAIHRGHFIMGELKALRNQAISIHLDTLFREHVCSCTSDSCPTCISFFEQKEALTQGEREMHHSRKGKAGGKKQQPRGKRRKSSWRYDSEDEDELFFRSPSPPPMKRKNTKWEQSQSDDYKKVKWSNRKETSKMFSPQSKMGEARMKHSNSDTDLHLHRKEDIKQDSNHSCDDSCLTPHSFPLGPSTSHSHSLSSTPGRWKEFPTRKEVPPKTKSHAYVLRSDQWASLSRTTLADLRLKQELDRGYVPYFEQQDRGESKTPCTRLIQNTLTVDILSINIGTHNISAHEGPLCWPKLYVSFSDRKLVYALSTRKQMMNSNERVSSQIMNSKDKKESVMKQLHSPEMTSQAKDEAAPHSLIFIDVPFTSLQALNISSNRVLVLVNALPSTYLMTWKEGCWTTVPGDHSVSPACHSHLAIIKAVLAVFPMHQLVLQHGKDQTLQDSLSEFSPWFKQILARPFPVQSNHTPSWALPSPAAPVDLSSTTTTTSTSTLSSSSSQSTTGESAILPSTTLPSTAPCTNQLAFISSSSMASPSRPSTSSAIQEETQYVGEPQQDGSHPVQTTNPVVCDAGALTASPALPSEVSIVSAVRAALQAQGIMHALPINLPLQYPSNLSLEKGCSCRGMCRTVECACARAGALCHPKQSCDCEDCDNPLNVLHILGLDMFSVRMDECLVQNLYSYNLAGLCSLLVSRVVLPCCGASSELLHIIPGTVTCTWCGMPVSYSWCSHHIHLQTLCPRNHCIACWCCKPVFHTHCQRCQQCTKSKHQGECEECGSNKF